MQTRPRNSVDDFGISKRMLRRNVSQASQLVALLILFGATARAESQTEFAPRISEFAVTFSGKPKLTAFETVTAEGDTVKGMRGELRSSDSFQRVEVVAMRPGFSIGETKESAIAKMKDYAVHNGLRSPEFTWEHTRLGKRLKYARDQDAGRQW